MSAPEFGLGDEVWVKGKIVSLTGVLDGGKADYRYEVNTASEQLDELPESELQIRLPSGVAPYEDLEVANGIIIRIMPKQVLGLGAHQETTYSVSFGLENDRLQMRTGHPLYLEGARALARHLQVITGGEIEEDI